ncbi:MAG: M20/M25/M40 family metallo-hydrolase [Candidatus Chisholmbacteria bacterium]|nr:M20/M25/M40 family metallo-hydrolase [Candidatus Chisholmbacteria bacterium]
MAASPVVTLTKELIAVPSTKENPQSLSKVLEVAAEPLKRFNSKTFTKNGIKSLLFYNTPKLPKKFKVILNAHLDVVPAKPNQFIPIVKGDKLYGRGAHDMKSGAAAEIIVFKELANKVNYPLGLQLVTDEEIGGSNGAKYQIDRGVRADFVLAGEPTDLKIEHQTKGVIWCTITFKGKSAHGAYPWRGRNALWQLKKFLDHLESTFPEPKKEVWQTTINLAQISTPNQTINKVPDEASVSLDVRFIPADKQTIVNTLKKLLPKGASIKYIAQEPAHFTATNNPYILDLSNAAKKVTSLAPKIVREHGASDVRHYSRVGTPAAIFGPKGAGLHTDSEWVSLKSLDTYSQILHAWLQKLQ